MKSFKPFLFTVLGAATITMSSEVTRAAFKVYSHTDSAQLYDGNADNDGDETFAENEQVVAVGEYSADAGENRAWIPFALTTEQIAAIATAESVTFGIYTGTSVSEGNPVGQTDLRGFDGKNSTLAGEPADEFHEATQLLKSAFTTPSTPIGFVTQDITAFAKAQALANNSVIALRIEVSGADVPNTDGVHNWYRFATEAEGGTTYDPYLEIVEAVPEPAGMALLGLAGMLGLRRRGRTS